MASRTTSTRHRELDSCASFAVSTAAAVATATAAAAALAAVQKQFWMLVLVGGTGGLLLVLAAMSWRAATPT